MLSLTQPLSDKTIEDAYDLTSVAQSEWRNISTILVNASDKQSKGFSNSMVRLKLIDPNGQIFLCDYYGNVKIGKKVAKLSDQDHKKLRRIILETLPSS